MRAPAAVPRLAATKRSAHGKPSTSPFRRGTAERPLRLLVDRATVSFDETVTALLGFGHHDLIEVIEFEGDGLLPAMTLGERDETLDIMPGSVVSTTWRQDFAVLGVQQLVEFAHEFRAEGLEAGVDSMTRELVLAHAGESIQADALVTDSAFLLRDALRGLVAGANPISPGEALSLVGLFLRARGDFTIAKDASFTFRLTRQRFDWALSRALLPEGWRYFSACLASDPELDSSVAYTGQAVLERFAQALRARERVLIHGRGGAGYGPADEQLFYFDHAVLALGGAFDSVARIAHVAYHVRGAQRAAGWRNDKWVRKLQEVAPNLAHLATPNEQVRDAVDAVATLRNTIHGVPLNGVRYSSEAGPEQHLVRVPPEAEKQVVELAERRGGTDRWGLVDLSPHALFFDAESVVEALMAETAQALNALMRETDVLLLPDVEPSALMSGPPDERSTEFSPGALAAIRCLAGL